MHPRGIGVAKRTAVRLIALPLILAVIILSVQVVAHFDGNSHDEAHCTCQICHVVHAAVPQPLAQAQIQIPVRIARFSPVERLSSSVESASSSSIPRAPPA